MENKDYKSIRHAKFQKDGILNNHNGYGVLRKKGDGFIKKFFFFSFFVFLVKFSNPHFANYGGEDYAYFIPEIKEEKSFLSDDGFILQKSIQTQKRKKTVGNEVIEHIVQEGETISQISVDYQLKSSTILGANPQISPYKSLKIGTVIKILPVDGVLISLKNDESLDEIAKNYKIDKEKIISQNLLDNSDLLLKKGIDLIIPGAKPIIPDRKSTFGNKAPKYVDSIKSYEKSDYLIWPTKGVITQYFHKGHYAIDIANVNKGPIFAATDGTVVKERSFGWNGGYGNMIIIDNGQGTRTLYAHDEKNYVKEGDVVKQGDTIGWMGNTGRVRGRTGIHLHFEVIVNGVKRNPLAYIK